MAASLRITTRNARFQQWQSLLGNRNKRLRAAEFLVHGVRPITLAVAHGWPIRALLHDHDRALSSWARDLIERVDTTHVAMAGDLLRDLGEKGDETPELIAVAGMPDDRLDRIALGPATLGVIFDRPVSPGNIGTLIRSADAFGATSVLITGHAADPYDPKSIRASAGSIFAVPVVRARSPHDVFAWLDAADVRPGDVKAPVRAAAASSASGRPAADPSVSGRAAADLSASSVHPRRGVRLVATDEHGAVDIADADLTGPLFLLIGNETAGLSTAWREECDLTVRIPITGSASSLNAASAATVALYEAVRQRAAATAA